MSTHTKHQLPGTYLVTFTCYKWLPLIEITHSYDQVYKWFSIIKEKGLPLFGYVIMPNHVHCLVYKSNTQIDLSRIVGSGKRFMAYEIVRRISNKKEFDILKQLKEGVSRKELMNGKKHQVFRLSFDGKYIESKEMLENVLDYIHHNPVMGRWNLVDDYANYEHSSAGWYEKGVNGVIEVTDYREFY